MAKIAIYLNEEVGLRLTTWNLLAQDREYSGYGFVERIKEGFMVYDVVLLDVGSYAWTQICPQDTLALGEREDVANMRCWFHKHPLGNTNPGPHNWSDTDEFTCRNTPLGQVPQLLRWSISIVCTPRGWVGRLDTYGENGRTMHLPVRSQQTIISQAAKDYDRLFKKFVDQYLTGHPKEAL